MDFEIKINDKLSLRIPKLEDSKDIFNVVDKDRKHLSKWLSWVEKVHSYKDTEINTAERIEKFNKKEAASFYAVYENKWIGSVGFISLNKTHKEGEIGYWISSDYEGKGLMTECVRASIKYGFKQLDLHRIVIRCSSANLKSSSIPRRLGFTHEGTLRQDRLENGAYTDTLVFGLLKSEWK